MAECYCAKIENGVITQVIVCNNPRWASRALGGEWICTEERLVGVGWSVINGEVISPPNDNAVQLPYDVP